MKNNKNLLGLIGFILILCAGYFYKHLFRWPFFFIKWYNFRMTKRYSGKSFKDSSVSKKPKLSLKEKRRLKKEKSKKS